MLKPNLSFFGLVLGLFVHLSPFSQDTTHVVRVLVNVRYEVPDTFALPLDSAVVEIYRDQVLVKTGFSNARGNLPEFEFPVNSGEYKIYIRKSGYVTKMALVNTSYSHPEDLAPTSYVQMSATLFETAENLDFSYLLEEPMIKFAISADGWPEYDKLYTQNMLVKIENTRRGH